MDKDMAFGYLVHELDTNKKLLDLYINHLVNKKVLSNDAKDSSKFEKLGYAVEMLNDNNKDMALLFAAMKKLKVKENVKSGEISR